MALSADANYNRRGPEPTRNEFGYPPSANAVIYRGAMIGITAGGTVQPIQTAGTVAFIGLADGASNTVGQPTVRPYVVGLKGTWGLTVPAAANGNINSPVYATDDGTCTLSSNSGSNLLIGTLVGLDNGQTFVSILGS